jgi:nicotinamidase-related amidase
MTKQALLVMDVQLGIVGRYTETDPDYFTRIRSALDHAHQGGVPVIYVVIGFRDGHPEVSAANKTFSALATGTRFTVADPDTSIHPDVGPVDGDIVVTKKRVSAFAGSDLEIVLRSRGVDHLVLAGIATSGVVLSTLRQAADLDYGLTVLADGCLDGDSEVHRVLMEKVFPRQAEVSSVADWVGREAG